MLEKACQFTLIRTEINLVKLATKMMKRVAILQTGINNPRMSASYPDYPGMFRSLIGGAQATPMIELISFPILEGSYLPKIDRFDGFLITGSASGVYENKSWMKSLFAFIREAHIKQKKIAGFCFGHQAIAVALGGKVIKSEKGWGVGIRKQSINGSRNWMKPEKKELELIYMHQDQVTTLPDSAVVLSGDEFCPFSAFSVGEHILCMQGHPEFSNEFTQDLIALRTSNIGKDRANIALESLSKPHDGPIVGQWIVNFFCGT